MTTFCSEETEMPTVGRIVLYRTDGRNGLCYDLPAIVTCTADSHPGDYPDGSPNPVPTPGPSRVHLTVFTPGGGYRVRNRVGAAWNRFLGAPSTVPGSGTYVQLNVARAGDLVLARRGQPVPRTWRWPR